VRRSVSSTLWLVASTVRRWLQRCVRTPTNYRRRNDVADPLARSSRLVRDHQRRLLVGVSRIRFRTLASATNSTHLWRTQDGGVLWSTLTFLLRPDRTSARGLYGEPEFSGPTAWCRDYPAGAPEHLLLRNRNGGVTWRREVGSHCDRREW